tara:strand:+ start:756 stop:1361 length:606 start_codon:yes stop_codon:yes gene_type:complete
LEELCQSLIGESDDEDEQMVHDFLLQVAMIKQQSRERRSATLAGLPKKRRTINRNKIEAHNRIMADYFIEKPLYSEELFRRRFRMSSRLFTFIQRTLEQHEKYFSYQKDCSGRPGATPLQKIVAAIRMIAYGEGGDRQDEYVKIGERTAHASRKEFCKSIVKHFETKYLRKPTAQDVDRLLEVNRRRGFPGMLGLHLTVLI